MKRLLFALGFMLTLLINPAAADTVNVYTIGSSPAGNALDPLGNNIGGIPVINWNHVGVAGASILTIVAEGIDTNEQDQVFFNGAFVGFLTNQGFQVSTFNLNPGAGAMLNGSTALTTSIFNVNAINGINTVSILVDNQNWVNEIEVSTLVAAVPEPETYAMLLAGLGVLGFAARRRKKM